MRRLESYVVPRIGLSGAGSVGHWVQAAQVAQEKYFLRKVKTGNTEPVYEKGILKALSIERLRS